MMGHDYLEDADIDGNIILNWVFEKDGVGLWTGCIWYRLEVSGRLCCNKPLGVISKVN